MVLIPGDDPEKGCMLRYVIWGLDAPVDPGLLVPPSRLVQVGADVSGASAVAATAVAPAAAR